MTDPIPNGTHPSLSSDGKHDELQSGIHTSSRLISNSGGRQNASSYDNDHIHDGSINRNDDTIDDGSEDDYSEGSSYEIDKDRVFMVIEEVPETPIPASQHHISSNREEIFHIGDFDSDNEAASVEASPTQDLSQNSHIPPHRHLPIGARSNRKVPIIDKENGGGGIWSTYWVDGRKEPGSPEGKADTMITEQDSSYSLSSFDDDNSNSPKIDANTTSLGKHVMITISSHDSVCTSTSSQDSVKLSWLGDLMDRPEEPKDDLIHQDQPNMTTKQSGRKHELKRKIDRSKAEGSDPVERIVIVGSMSGDWDEPVPMKSFSAENYSICSDHDCRSVDGTDEALAAPPQLIRSENPAGDAPKFESQDKESTTKNALITDSESSNWELDEDSPEIATASLYLNPSPTKSQGHGKFGIDARTKIEKEDGEAVREMNGSESRGQKGVLQSSASSSSFERDFGRDVRTSTPIRPSTRHSYLSPIRSMNDDALQAALLTPVVVRRESLASEIKCSPRSQVHEEDEAIKAAARTPIHKRQASLTDALSRPLVKDDKDEDEALRHASLTPVHKRQASLTGDSTSVFRSSLQDKDVVEAACSTPVEKRKAALTNEVAPIQRKATPESDDALMAASATPVIARREQFIRESSSIFRKSQVDDAALQAASSTPVDSRRASLPLDKDAKPSTPERHNTLLACAAQASSRRRSPSAGPPSAARSSPGSSDALDAASKVPVNERREALARGFSQSACASLRLQAELDALKQKSLVSSRCQHRNRRARNDRLFFRLGQKKGGMSEKDYLRLENFLPHDRVMYELKATSGLYDFQDEPPMNEDLENLTLRIWLTCPTEKIFEIVTVTLRAKMTVEEVLEEACSLALDPVLSEQQYVSLCNKKHEMVNSPKSVAPLVNGTSSSKRHLTLMAVPFGSTAALVRAIRRVLEKTDRVKRALTKRERDPLSMSNGKKSREWV